MNRKQCPKCKGHGTEKVHVEWNQRDLEEIRQCDCGAEYSVAFEVVDKDVHQIYDL